MRGAEHFAYRLMTGMTIPALPARHMMRGEDSVPHTEIFNTGADFDDVAGNLVPQDERRLFDAVPFHQIAAANAAGANAHQQLTGSDLRNAHLFKPHVLITVIHGHSHAAAARFLPRVAQILM